MISKEKRVYQVCTYLFVITVLCHLLVAAFLIFNPSKHPPANHRWEKAYRLFGVTGPFFSEDRINSIPRVYCSIKHPGGNWTNYHELGKDEFNQFHANYLKFDQLLLSGLPRYLSRQINIHQDEEERNIYLHSLRTYIQLRNPSIEIDSVRIVYTLESLVETQVDTFFIKKIGGFQQPVQ